MRSRFLLELTTPELEKYFAGGGRTAVLPVGCVEMHGPHQPLGTDTFIAKAIALLAARGADGIVLPEILYSWAGATDGFAGTISIDSMLEQKLIEAVCERALKMGFKRLVLLNVHGPNNNLLFTCVRNLFERTHVPVLAVDAYKPFTDEIAAIFDGPWEESKEASLVLGALNILGLPGLYTEKEMSYEDEAPKYPESFYRLMGVGTVGFFMQDIRQHACPTKFVSVEKAMEFMNRQAEHIIKAIDDLAEYSMDIANDSNKGWL